MLTEPLEKQGARGKAPSDPPGWPRKIANAAFQGPAGDLVRALEPYTESDPVGILAQTLVACGNRFGRTAHFKVEADDHYCNLYAVLVGATGKARKGTSLGHVRRANARGDAWYIDCVKTGLSSGEGILHAVRDAAGKDGGVEDKRLLAVEPEFATLLRHMERQGNTLSSQLRQLWDAPPVCQTLTRANPVKATGAHVSIIGHVTAEELRRYLTQTEMANGLGNRFLWLAVKRSKYLPEGGALEQGTLNDLAEQFTNAVEFAADLKHPVSFSTEARDLWREVYPELSEGQPGLSGAMIGRAEAQVRRLATIYAILNRCPECRTQHLKAALALWEYARETVYFVFGENTGDPVADAILDGLRDASPNGLTRTAISASFAATAAPPKSTADSNCSKARGLPTVGPAERKAVTRKSGTGIVRKKRNKRAGRLLSFLSYRTRWIAVSRHRHLGSILKGCAGAPG